MAITYIGGVSTSYVRQLNGTTTDAAGDVACPAGIVAGDLIMISIDDASSAGITVSIAGRSATQLSRNAEATTYQSTQCYLIANGTEASVVPQFRGTTSAQFVYVVHVYRTSYGTFDVNPFGQVAYTSHGSSVTTGSTPQVSNTRSGASLLTYISGYNGDSSGPFVEERPTSATAGTATVDRGSTMNTNHPAQAYLKDGIGVGTFGSDSWSAPRASNFYSYTMVLNAVNHAPSAPANVSVASGRSLTVSWTHTDAENDPQTKYQIRWRKSS